jgi:23S rRNA (adenine2503-C2)-methyltransferase
MVEQALAVRRESPERPLTGAVFQGQGEPFQNYNNVLRAARILRDPSGPRIGSDRITISTVGLLPQIERYTEEGHRYRLILSLTSAFSEKRETLVPITARYGVPELAAAMRRHATARGGPVNLAWVLISGFNTGMEEARELARLFRGVPVRLSVIDVNDPAGGFGRATDEERRRFLSALADHGLGFVRRYSGGPDIDAACGMLASRARGGKPHQPPAPSSS